jgi:hypothetical protein
MPVHKTPPVGVLAATQNIARSLVQELGITKPVILGKRSSIRGLHLSTLLVDDSAWPLTVDEYLELQPCLQREWGYMLHLQRHDLSKWEPSQECG